MASSPHHLPAKCAGHMRHCEIKPSLSPMRAYVLCFAGSARLALRVHKCRMQYRGAIEQPFFTLSVRGRGGSLLEPNQDTPPGIYANGAVSADHTLVLTTPIAQIPQGSCLKAHSAVLCCAVLCDSLCYVSMNVPHSLACQLCRSYVSVTSQRQFQDQSCCVPICSVQCFVA